MAPYLGKLNHHILVLMFETVFAFSCVGFYLFYRASYASAVLAVIGCLSVCLSVRLSQVGVVQRWLCLLYTSDAADDLLCVDLGGRRIIKKKKI